MQGSGEEGEMGNTEKERLNQLLASHLNTVHETLQLFDQMPTSSEKVSWTQVVQMGEQLSRQATIVGMLWTGEDPKAKELEENMDTYFNVLQGFLLLSHGSAVGAGPTLSLSIHESVKQVVSSSFKLLNESISLYGIPNSSKKASIPQFVGSVWEACSALKKAPSTNITSIGRAMTQVAVSVKDVLREMEELKQASPDTVAEASDDASVGIESKLENDNLGEDDLGNDLSAEEMEVALLAKNVVSETLATLKELIRTITGLLKLENPTDNSKFVDSLERLLKFCREIGEQIDELGASLYPPQEVDAIKAGLENMSSCIAGMQLEVESFRCSSELFVQACSALRSSITQMKLELESTSNKDVADKLQNLSLAS